MIYLVCLESTSSLLPWPWQIYFILFYEVLPQSSFSTSVLLFTNARIINKKTRIEICVPASVEQWTKLWRANGRKNQYDEPNEKWCVHVVRGRKKKVLSGFSNINISTIWQSGRYCSNPIYQSKIYCLFTLLNCLRRIKMMGVWPFSLPLFFSLSLFRFLSLCFFINSRNFLHVLTTCENVWTISMITAICNTVESGCEWFVFKYWQICENWKKENIYFRSKINQINGWIGFGWQKNWNCTMFNKWYSAYLI